MKIGSTFFLNEELAPLGFNFHLFLLKSVVDFLGKLPPVSGQKENRRTTENAEKWDLISANVYEFQPKKQILRKIDF